MKAWKVEHDKQVAEEEKKKQDKDKKGKKSARSRSASPKKVSMEKGLFNFMGKMLAVESLCIGHCVPFSVLKNWYCW